MVDMAGFSLAWLDIVIVVVVAVSVFIGFTRGFFRELLSLSVWVGAIVLSVSLNSQANQWLSSYIAMPELRVGASWVLVFLASLLLGAVATSLLVKLVHVTGLRGTDQCLGMVFGALRAIAVLVVFSVGFKLFFPVEQHPIWQRALLIPPLQMAESHVLALSGKLYPEFKQRLQIKQSVMP